MNDLLAARVLLPSHFLDGGPVEVPVVNTALTDAETFPGRVWDRFHVSSTSTYSVVVAKGRGSADWFEADPRIVFHDAGTCAPCDADRVALRRHDELQLHRLQGQMPLA